MGSQDSWGVGVLHPGQGLAWGLCYQRYIQLLEVGTPRLACIVLYRLQLLWPRLGREQRWLQTWPGAQDGRQEWGAGLKGGTLLEACLCPSCTQAWTPSCERLQF